MTRENGYERPAIAGSGTIATGLAAVASTLGEVTLLARSPESASRAEAKAQKAASRLDGADPERITVTTDPSALSACDIVVEAIVEDAEAKGSLLSELGAIAADADLATTTSSLSITDLGERSGHAERFFGLHVFNPVPRMDLIELCVPDAAREGLGDRARAWCAALGKTAVDVPDSAGFVVNRLLFPYLFDAAKFMEESGLEPKAVDDCMRLGAGHPMGPLALLDFVGLDVSKAIGEMLFEASGNPAHQPPASMSDLVAAGKLGRKTGEGYYTYGD